MIRPDLAKWLKEWREPLIYGGLGAALLIWFAQSGLLFTWVGAILSLCGGIVLFWFFRAAYREASLHSGTGDGPGVVEISERRIGYLSATTGGFVDLDLLAGVDIVTTADGPFGEDLYWVLTAEDGAALAIPNGAVGADGLLGALEGLPGLDYDQITAAMGATEAARFTIWRAPGRALASDPGGA